MPRENAVLPLLFSYFLLEPTRKKKNIAPRPSASFVYEIVKIACLYNKNKKKEI